MPDNPAPNDPAEEGPGPPLALTCPECDGALREVEVGQVLRFRCPLGHGYSARTLLAELSLAREDARWSALRALRDEKALARRLAAPSAPRGNTAWAAFLRGWSVAGVERRA